MHSSSFTRRNLIRFAAMLAILSCAAQAQTVIFPTKPVTLVVPYSAGGGTDIVGRMFAQKLSELWGQSVVVENRTGANGVIGSSHVAKSQADGYTLMLVVGSHAINPVLMKRLPYDTKTAFTPITLLASSPTVVVSSAKGAYQHLDDVVTAAKKNELSYGYSEGQTRLSGELLRQSAGLKMTGVPYKGGAPIMVDVIGGHLPLGVTSVLTALPHVTAGNLRVVAVMADQRLPIFPDAVTPAEVGIHGVESHSWYGMFGPKGIPNEIVQKIHNDLKKVASDPSIVKQMDAQGARIIMSSQKEFAEFIENETSKWSEVARKGGIKAE